MVRVDRPEGDITRPVKTNNASSCLNRCQQNRECSLWTYRSGECWLKNQNTFTVHNSAEQASGTTFVSGIKNCSAGRTN